MKIPYLFLTLLGFATVSACGQYGPGEVIFANTTGTAARISTNSAPGGPATGPISGVGNYYFALFVAPSNVLSVEGVVFHDPDWAFTGNYATNTTGAGRFWGSYNPDGSVTIPGYEAGMTASLVVIGWSANIAGPDLAAVEAWYGYDGSDVPFVGWFGQSAVASIQLGNGGLIPNMFVIGPTVFGAAQGFTLNLIPEPTTIGLAGLAVVLLFRRLKTARSS
jgi:hypothetical protein